jgi:transposase
LAQIVNGKKVIHSRLIEGGMKSKEFHEFLSDLRLPTSEKHYLIMDNLSVHKAKDSCLKLGLSPIKELLASKNIEAIYLPSYTPELNPVEKCFNITRQYVEKCRPRIKEKLETFLKEKLEFFQEADLTKYLENSIQECLTKLSAQNNIETSFGQKAANFVLEGLKWIEEVRPNLDINLA